MATYPRIIIPKEVSTILKQTSFKRPTEPIRPNPPQKENNLGFKFILLVAGVVTLIFAPLLGVLFLVIAILWLFANPERKQFEKATKTYQTEIRLYEKALKEYQNSLSIPDDLFQQIERKKFILIALKRTKLFDEEQDYKKGASHDFFKWYLKCFFGDCIVENAALLLSSEYSFGEDIVGNEKRPYITDFAYFDKHTNLCIAIEIDEPYTLVGKKPIHINDEQRNEFFNKSNWFTVRFAEEQVVNSPEQCCKLLFDLVHLILVDLKFCHPFTIKTELTNIECWNDEAVRELIRNDVRNSYINRIHSASTRQVKGLTIEQIKTVLGFNQLRMVRQLDAQKNKTSWLSHWDNDRRIRVTMHEDIFFKIESDRSFSSLKLNTEIVLNTHTHPYLRYVVNEV